MQVMFNQIDDHQAVQLLLKDLVERNKEVRYKLILDQIEDEILIKWLDYVHKNRCWNRPVKCIVKFRSDYSVLEQPGSHFVLSAQIEDINNDGFEDYTKRVRNALKDMRYELRNKYNLDHVVFDVVDGHEAIDVFEYHDFAKGF